MNDRSRDKTASQDATGEPEIVFDNVDKAFGEVIALRGVNFTVHKGETVCLLGPSGCGKSTCLMLAAGFDEPTGGEVKIGGRQVGRPGPDRSVVFQTASLLPWATVFKNITLGPRSRGEKGYQDRARELLELMGLSEFRDSYPYQLSGGMKQRVSIARALIGSPDALLMDEPFGALDAQTRLSMQELLQGIVLKLHPTIMFITHDVEEAIFLGDRVLVMSSRPGCVADDFEVDLPRPRDYEMMATPEFVDLKRRALHMLRGEPNAAA